MRADDAGVREEHVEAPVPRHSVVDDGAHGGLIGGVEGPHVDLSAGVPRGDLVPVGLQVRGVPVTDVQRLRPILRVQVGGGAANAKS